MQYVNLSQHYYRFVLFSRRCTSFLHRFVTVGNFWKHSDCGNCFFFFSLARKICQGGFHLSLDFYASPFRKYPKRGKLIQVKSPARTRLHLSRKSILEKIESNALLFHISTSANSPLPRARGTCLLPRPPWYQGEKSTSSFLSEFILLTSFRTHAPNGEKIAPVSTKIFFSFLFLTKFKQATY